MENNDKKVLEYLNTHRRYVTSMKIAQFLNVPEKYIRESLERLENSKLIVIYQGKKMRKGHILVKEYLLGQVLSYNNLRYLTQTLLSLHLLSVLVSLLHWGF